MTNDEIKEHFEYLHGLRLAHSTALTLLLQAQPNLGDLLRQYMSTLDRDPSFAALSAIAQESFVKELKEITR